MALERGEALALGVAIETARGTFVAAQDYVRQREPSTIQRVTEEVDIKETRPTGVSRDAKVIVMQKVEGDVALNLRFRTIGYFLKSLLGGWSSATEVGQTTVYRHTGTLNPNVLQPTLSLSMARGTYPHKQIPGAVVTKMGLKFPVDDVINGSVTIKGLTETTVANFTPAYAATDYLAPHQMVTVKIAANTAGLGAATALVATDLEINLTRDNMDRVNISSILPVDFVAKLLDITGKFTMDKSDDTYKDLADAGTSRAMSITVTNTAQSIGSPTTNPQLVITLPNVTLNTTEKRPLDGIVTEEVTFEANYDDTAASAITVSLLNEKINYN
jgi:hypothetical protein